MWSESCEDGRKNQNEAGIDCGGPCKTACGKIKSFRTLQTAKNYFYFDLVLRLIVFWFHLYSESCNDGKKNQDESGVDCGGSCKACGRSNNQRHNYPLLDFNNQFMNNKDLNNSYELSLSKNAKTIPIALQTVLVLTVYAKVSILIKYSKKHKLRNLSFYIRFLIYQGVKLIYRKLDFDSWYKSMDYLMVCWKWSTKQL